MRLSALQKKVKVTKTYSTVLRKQMSEWDVQNESDERANIREDGWTTSKEDANKISHEIHLYLPILWMSWEK